MFHILMYMYSKQSSTKPMFELNNWYSYCLACLETGLWFTAGSLPLTALSLTPYSPLLYSLSLPLSSPSLCLFIFPSLCLFLFPSLYPFLTPLSFFLPLSFTLPLFTSFLSLSLSLNLFPSSPLLSPTPILLYFLFLSSFCKVPSSVLVCSYTSLMHVNFTVREKGN